MINIKTSPTKLSSGNKRLTKVPIFIIIGIVLLILFAIFYAALSRKQSISNQQNPEAVEKKQQKSSSNDDNNLTSYVDSLSRDSKKKMLEEKQVENEKIEKEELHNKHNEVTPNPLNYNSSTVVANNRDNEKELQLKRDMRLKALTSNSKLDIKLEKNNQSNKDNKESLDFNDEVDPATAEFVKKTLSKGYLQQEKQKPISKFEIKAGWMIPAILITGLNSDLPGEVLAQVTQNIYDTATGKYLLIPQGTKLVGNYSSNIIYGQERVLTAWSKLIFPNGDTLNLEGMGGISQDGYSGFSDQVNNHYLKIFGSAFLLSSITAGIALTDNSDGEKETNSDKAMSQAINQMSTVASEMIRKNMNIAPTLEIRPGYKFNIFVTKDIILEPLKVEK
ncbi:conjugal transfer protein TrbI [Aliarcobacter butzleri]|uniref:Conjugal transfer protein TrbI n=1 Tax=Aliarcobacter butzleri TaxID=28197 RepID=A0AAW7PZK0_9BACT|nr:TrbI/VirB10 family protein [Aliarcobacter butzleri]MDN5071439.1 conjugal transfer protein TrbI [Aliarcobacter butzleri]